MNLAACERLVTRPLTGTWYRAIQLKFWNSLLATAHTATIPGRFNAGNSTRSGFEILYFAEDQQVALFEVQALLGSPYPGTNVPNPSGAWVLINVDIQLSRIADLTRVPQRRRIDSTVQELTGDWRGYLLRNPHPNLASPFWTQVPTQKLGTRCTTFPTWKGLSPIPRGCRHARISSSSRANCGRGVLCDSRTRSQGP